MGEVPLTGGRVTSAVTRVGGTVRRPPRPNSRLVRDLLAHLAEQGFDGAPRYLGRDEHGREVFTFLEGEVPPELNASIPDDVLVAAARLIREYHDATADCSLTGDQEVVCHGDLSPCNFVFRSGLPVAIIDFDAAAPGKRLADVGYALFLWLNLGTDGLGLSEQARRIRVFCDAYGTVADEALVAAVSDAVAENVGRLRDDGRAGDAEWWQAQLEWLAARRHDLTRLLDTRDG